MRPDDRPDGVRRRRGRHLRRRWAAGRCSTRRTTQGRLVREGDPEWRDDVPVRVETIPVRRAGRVIAVVGAHTNLLGVRTPSRLELSYLQTAADLTQMIATGHFPATGQRSDHADSPRVGDGFLRVDAAGRVVYASPNALSVYRRLGLSGDLAGLSCAELDPRAGAAAAPSRRGDAQRGARRPRAPRHRDRHRRGVADRPLDPAATRGDHIGGADPGARRHRPAPPRPRAGHQGRDHPRDPPPGEEQPADRRRAAAAAGAPDRHRDGQAGARGGGTPGRVDRDRARDAQPGGRGDASTSTRSPTGSGAMVTDVSALTGRVRVRRDGSVRRAAVGGGHRAGDGADRAAPERRRARLRRRPTRRRTGAIVVARRATWSAGCTSPSTTTAAGCPRASTSTGRPTWGSRSCAPSSSRSSAVSSSWRPAPGRRHPGRGRRTARRSTVSRSRQAVRPGRGRCGA